jgi:hypothetical protein
LSAFEAVLLLSLVRGPARGTSAHPRQFVVAILL